MFINLFIVITIQLNKLEEELTLKFEEDLKSRIEKLENQHKEKMKEKEEESENLQKELKSLQVKVLCRSFHRPFRSGNCTRFG